MRYKHRGKLINPMQLVYLFPENSPFLTSEAKLFAYCESDGITNLYAFLSGAKTCIPKILRVFAKTIKVPTYHGTATMYAIPVERAFSLSDKVRYVVLPKSDELVDSVCLQALGKLAGYFYLSQFSWDFDQRIEKIAVEVCDRNFPDIPPVSFCLEVLAVLEPYYKLAQFIKPTELAKTYDDFADMVDRAERFLSDNNRCWNDFTYRTVLSLASFLKKNATASGLKEVVLYGAEKAFARRRHTDQNFSLDDGTVEVLLDVVA